MLPALPAPGRSPLSNALDIPPLRSLDYSSYEQSNGTDSTASSGDARRRFLCLGLGRMYRYNAYIGIYMGFIGNIQGHTRG